MQSLFIFPFGEGWRQQRTRQGSEGAFWESLRPSERDGRTHTEAPHSCPPRLGVLAQVGSSEPSTAHTCCLTG